VARRHGETRIIRKAYFEHPNYVPLAVRAYDLWRELESETGANLMRLSGVLLAGPPEGEAVGGAKISANQHNLELEELTPEEARNRFPGFSFSEEMAVVHEPDAGYLFVEQCVQAHIDQALELGGTLKTDETAREWQSDDKTVTVQTENARYQADRLVITAGGWSAKILKDLALPLRVLRKPVFWLTVSQDLKNNLARLPAFLYELPEGVFYGLPGTDGTSLKLAEHSGGELVDNPNLASRELDPEDRTKILGFSDRWLPLSEPAIRKHSICFYTMTPDSHFIIDRHPNYANVVFGAGFSGHGFKFTGVLGQALADLALEGSTSLPIHFLSLGRETLNAE
jgi:sarcosine oxidase